MWRGELEDHFSPYSSFHPGRGPLVLIQQVLSRSRVPHMVARSPDHLAKQINNLLLDNGSSEFCFISGFNRCDRDLDRWPTIARDRKVSF